MLIKNNGANKEVSQETKKKIHIEDVPQYSVKPCRL